MLRRNKIQMTVILELEVGDKLDAIATARRKATGENTTRTELIREAVDRFITQEEGMR